MQESSPGSSACPQPCLQLQPSALRLRLQSSDLSAAPVLPLQDWRPLETPGCLRLQSLVPTGAPCMHIMPPVHSSFCAT